MAPRISHHFADVRVHAAVPETIQTKLTINQPGDVYEQEAERVAERVVNASPHPVQVQQQAAPQSASSPMPASVQETLSSPGEPLTTGTRSQMERQFGHDFNRIRIHADSRASTSTYAVSALAYTVGEDVVFRTGKYTPETTEGKRLLAHELTHVLQQEKMLQGESLQEVGLPQDNPVVPQQMAPGINRPIAFMQRQGDNDNNGDDNDQGGGGRGRDRSRQSRPIDAPTGTVPIDESGLSKDEIHKIKDGVGAGPRDWVGITPEGHVIVTGDDGQAVDEGPADSYYREGISMSKILEVLEILGISIFLAVAIAAAILDPEPASKLGLLGLSAATIILLLTKLGIRSRAQTSQDTGTRSDNQVASAGTNSSTATPSEEESAVS
ncbi:MAG TPA: DUF4157 domain-containing protein [Ktedonobacteraceae bacterium]